MCKENKPFVPFTNDLMFGEVMSQENIAKDFLECVLGKEITSVSVRSQEEANPNPFSRGVRMDVFVKGENEVYDVEMQTYDDAALFKRMRYVQSCIDSKNTPKGTEYKGLVNSYIIFICTNFRLSLEPVCTFSVICEEDSFLKVDTGAKWMVLNAREHGLAVGNMADLLKYISTGETSEFGLVKTIDSQVRRINEDAEKVAQMLDYETKRQMDVTDAKNAGRVEATTKLFKLYNCLKEQNREQEFEKCSSDSALREKLYQEFGIS